MNAFLLLLISAFSICFVESSGFYGKSNPVKDISAAEFKSAVIESTHVSVVEFYAPWCGHCQNLKSEYIKAAKSTRGLINMVAVNCDEDSNKPLCAQYDIKGFPTIKVFQAPKNKTIRTKGGKKVKARPTVEDYQGKRDAHSIASFAVSRIPNKVKYVDSSDHLNEFLDASAYPKVIYLAISKTEKKVSAKNIPPILKVLAIDASSSSFSYIPPTSTSSKVEKLHEKLHSKTHEKGVLLVIPKKDEQPIEYEGQMNKEAVLEFIERIKMDFNEKPETENIISTASISTDGYDEETNEKNGEKKGKDEL